MTRPLRHAARSVAALILTAALAQAEDVAAQSSPAPTSTPKPKDCATAEYRQFDFWLGTWEVHLPDGSLAGHNTIEAILDGCAVTEHWTGARGGRGTSLNFYDGVTKRWSQTWIDNHGSPLRLEGGVRDGAMVLEGDQTDAAGQTVRNRVTWTPRADRHVRQLWESSKDRGATWSVEFDGDYAPRASHSSKSEPAT